ncbi:CRISPR-associated helicase/endonuclease Cas3 [Bacteroidales bacterium]|nr:CRISPR-associated helicase/endonuclease Cas3 [Bacteroidales bacterium]
MISDYKAKSDGTTLIAHTQDVIEAGLGLLEVLIIDKEYWGPKIIRSALFHDFGKMHPDFQAKLDPNLGSKLAIRHELISVFYCLNIPFDEIFAIATHHKGIGRMSEGGNKRLSTALILESEAQNEEVSELLEAELQEWLAFFGIKLPELFADLKCLKLALNSKGQMKLTDQERLNLALMRSLLISADHLASAGKTDLLPKPIFLKVSDFQPSFNDKPIPLRDFQLKMSSIEGDVLLHAPTGSGKTEAAMCWLTKNQTANARLFYLLPYTASANAMVRRLEEIYGKDQVTALHSKSLSFFFDELASDGRDDSGKCSLDIQEEAKEKKQLSKEIFYPVKVATPYQIIKNALLSRGWEMCLWEYKEAIFIIDEFHTYDALLTGLIFATAKWLKREFNAKILFMSATIPKFMEAYILDKLLDGNQNRIIKPNITSASDALIMGQKRHILHFNDQDTILSSIDEIKNLLNGVNGTPKKVLVVVNNVKTAQEIFSRIDFDGNKAMLHGGFNKKDRTRIEKKIISKDPNEIPNLLVSTQAVEVSLDIDYDCAFIENAPIDALIQRFGRVNRTGKKSIAEVTLFKKNEGKTPFYDPDVCESTWLELFKLKGQALSEDDLIEACNSVYELGYNEHQLKDFELGFNNETINNFKSNLLAGDWSNAFEKVFENDKQKVEIICQNLIDDYRNLIFKKHYIEANQLLVSVYWHQLTDRKARDKELNVIVGYGFFYNSEVGYRVETTDDKCL